MSGWMKENFDQYFGWTYTGVNFSIEGTGGSECVNYIPAIQKLVQTVTAMVLTVPLCIYSYQQLKMPHQMPVINQKYLCGKTCLLVLLCLTFGCELGYKLVSGQMLWVLNPCHIITCIQIYLLSAPPTRFTTGLFRVQMHWSHGGTLALMFPILNTRLLPYEVHVYYVQHLLLLVVPVYLLLVGGPYTLEPLADYTWCLFSCCLYFFYFWIVLQGTALVTEVNLSNILCPAVSDPFAGKHYQLCAVVHQTACVMIHGKIIALVAQIVLPHPCSTKEVCIHSSQNNSPSINQTNNGVNNTDTLHNGNGHTHYKEH